MIALLMALALVAFAGYELRRGNRARAYCCLAFASFSLGVFSYLLLLPGLVLVVLAIYRVQRYGEVL
jgi:hypothetical protein